MRPGILFIIFSLLTLSGCTLVHLYSSANEARTGYPPPIQTRANAVLDNVDLAQGVFVGIAMSGGDGDDQERGRSDQSGREDAPRTVAGGVTCP